MSNMSYCRFQNTENDLRDCFETFDKLIAEHGSLEKAIKSLSRDEQSAARKLVDLCADIGDMYE